MRAIGRGTKLTPAASHDISAALAQMPYSGAAFAGRLDLETATLGDLLDRLAELGAEMDRAANEHRDRGTELDAIRDDLRGAASLYNRVTTIARELRAAEEGG